SAGMLMIPYLLAASGFSSTSSLTTLSLPAYSLAISSRAGAIARQGPHQGAQKSTRTGKGAPSTSVPNVWSVTATLFDMESTPWVAVMMGACTCVGMREAAERMQALPGGPQHK